MPTAEGSPAGNRALTIQDELITLAPPPTLSSLAGLQASRKQIVEKLRADTFNHFPRTQDDNGGRDARRAGWVPA
jgi:hypothetical protein